MIEPAQSITIELPRTINVRGDRDDIEQIFRPYLVSNIVRSEDTTHASVGVGMRSIPIEVHNTIPGGDVLVTFQTDINIVEKPPGVTVDDYVDLGEKVDDTGTN